MRGVPGRLGLAGWVLGGAALAWGAAGSGCGGTPAAPGAAGALEPGIIGAKVRLLVVRENDAARREVSARLARVLGPFAGKPRPGEDGAAWKSMRDRLKLAGLRPVVAPRESLADLEAALDARASGGELSLGQSAKWTVVASGAELPEGTAVRVHDGLMHISGGRLRLLLRCFAAPWGAREDGTPAAGLRIDAAPQHEAARASASDFASALEAPRLRTTEDAGQIFGSLALEAFIGPDEVLLIVPEAPQEGWDGGGPSGDLGPTPMDGPLPELGLEFSGVGPTPPRPKTVGEWILTDASDISDPGKRLIVVVDPILPRGYMLLPEGR